MTNSPIQITEWRPELLEAAAVERDVTMLAEVLRAVVYGGAGVSFFVPFSLDEAREFWTANVLAGVRAGTRRVLVARQEERIVGTVQINLAVPPNQQHRADVAKLLVHPDARRQGIARSLMLAVEPIARAEGRTLLTLDTVSRSSAESLYLQLGYVAAGVIPRYARGSLAPDLEDTTVMYKDLTP